ncbi:hypothetical protein AN641_03425 [Candidatus Epulonipiscioides gigas]|nr:hypothetical protein AN641_03425 [Epulopiscium sp. SCG-C07WGA-EpuloA2]
MYTHNSRISMRQFKILLLLQMFNMSILVLPNTCAKIASRDGYWLPVFSLIIGVVYIYVITSLIDRFRGQSFVDYTQAILTKPFGIALTIFFAIKIVISTGLELRLFTEMINLALLPNTPLEVIALLMLFVCYYLVKSGIEAQGRMAEILVYFVFVPVILVMCFIMYKADYEQLLPMFQWEIQDAIKGSFMTSVTYMPLEFVLVIGAFANRPQKIRKCCFFAVGVITILEILIIILTFTGIGTIETEREIWPVLALMQSIQLPGSFLENQEILMMAWWIMSVFMYISGGVYVSSLLIGNLFKFKRTNVTVIPIIPFIFLVAIFPDGLVYAYDYFVGFQVKMGIWFLFIIPLALILIAKLRKVGAHETQP